MKPHVTLVNPPAPSGSAGHLPFALLGLGYLAAVLEKNQYEVDVIDCQALKLSYEEFKSEIATGISAPPMVRRCTATDQDGETGTGQRRAACEPHILHCHSPSSDRGRKDARQGLIAA